MGNHHVISEMLCLYRGRQMTGGSLNDDIEAVGWQYVERVISVCMDKSKLGVQRNCG